MARSTAQLLTALDAAQAGDIVYVPSTVEIDLRDRWSIEVPPGVRLQSSGRHVRGGGALIRSPPGDEGPERTSKKIELGEGARLSGFQLRGHHHEYVNPIEAHDGDFYAHRGSGIAAGTDSVVDNNHISGWVFAGVWAGDNAHIHHNHIHHQPWGGLGYGVVIPAGEHNPLIEYNTFNYNRRAIAGTGGPGVSYVARKNVVGPDWLGAQFDMHGDENGDMTGTAGDRIVIEHNTFIGTHTVEEKERRPNQLVPAIHVRGVPETCVWVKHNRFSHASREEAYQQTGGPKKVHFAGNEYASQDEAASEWPADMRESVPDRSV